MCHPKSGAYIHIHTYITKHTHTHTYIHQTYIRICHPKSGSYIHQQNTHTYVHTCIHTYIRLTSESVTQSPVPVFDFFPPGSLSSSNNTCVCIMCVCGVCVCVWCVCEREYMVCACVCIWCVCVRVSSFRLLPSWKP